MHVGSVALSLPLAQPARDCATSVALALRSRVVRSAPCAQLVAAAVTVLAWNTLTTAVGRQPALRTVTYEGKAQHALLQESAGGVCEPYAQEWLASIRASLAAWRLPAPASNVGMGGAQVADGRGRYAPDHPASLQRRARVPVSWGRWLQLNGSMPESPTHMKLLLVSGRAHIMAHDLSVPDLHEWLRGMAGQLVDALDAKWDAAGAPALPSSALGFMLSTRDWPFGDMADHPEPYPVLGVTSTPKHWDIPVPGAHVVRAHRWATRMDRGDEARVPWEKRIPKAVFRGSATCPGVLGNDRYHACPRVVAWKAGRARPDVLDVGLTNFFGMPETRNETAAEPMSFADHSAYKYALSFDGHSYAMRATELLATGSTLLMATSLYGYREFYYSALVPWRHYVPFGCFSDSCVAVAVAEKLQQRDADARAIGEAGTAFLHTYLSDAGRACYWRLLLRELEPLYDFGGSDARAVRDLASRLPTLAPKAGNSADVVRADVSPATLR
jgi:hypothetical protein